MPSCRDNAISGSGPTPKFSTGGALLSRRPRDSIKPERTSELRNHCQGIARMMIHHKTALSFKVPVKLVPHRRSMPRCLDVSGNIQPCWIAKFGCQGPSLSPSDRNYSLFRLPDRVQCQVGPRFMTSWKAESERSDVLNSRADGMQCLYLRTGRYKEVLERRPLAGAASSPKI